MGTQVIVGKLPIVRDVAHLLQGYEEIEIEDFLAVSAIETLDIGILGRAAGLDKIQADVYLSVSSSPPCYRPHRRL